MILTNVSEALMNCRKDNETSLREITVAEIKKTLKYGEFAKVPMLPKVQACLRFTERTGKRSLISSLDKALEPIRGERRTKIIPFK
jgi:carbamate kinase